MPIDFDNNLTPEIFGQAQTLYKTGQTDPMKYPFGVIMIGYVILLGVALVRDPSKGLMVLGLLVALVVVFAISGVLTPKLAIEQQSRIANLFKPQKGKVDKVYIGWQDDETFTRIKWSYFVGYTANDSIILLYVSALNYYILHTSFFATRDDWNAVNTVVKEQVTPFNPKQWSNRYTNQNAVWTALFFTVVIGGIALVFA